MTTPFAISIVTEPRRLNSSVASLNQYALQNLQQIIQPLIRPASTQSLSSPLAQFITSPQPGYGKSHLIGRLFQSLRGQASLIYLRPFEDSASCWSSLLLQTVQELEYIDNTKYKCDDGQQLELFAHALLCYALQHISLPNAKIMLTLSLSKLRQNKQYMDQIHRRYKEIATLFKQNVDFYRYGASLSTWLCVLWYYSYFHNDYEGREYCLDWLKGSHIDVHWAEKIGIRQHDNPAYELDSHANDSICKQRLLDFCQLASFFRPFLFCFDQTENYAKNDELARCFGIVIENMVATAANQISIITANQVAWTNSIKPHWEEAHQHRLSPALELEGINIKQAKQLLEQRTANLTAKDDTKQHINMFMREQWWHDIFSESSEIGVRAFLRHCHAHWGVAQPFDLSTQHKQRTKELLQQYSIKPIPYAPDTLRWLIFEVVIVLKYVQKIMPERQGVFTRYCQLDNNHIVHFGFESSSNHSRWRNIASTANRLCWEAQKRGENSKSVLIRTPDLPVIPKPSWQIIGDEIRAAQDSGQLHIIQLNAEQTAAIYAAYSLYLDAREGNIDADITAIIKLASIVFMPLWDDIWV